MQPQKTTEKQLVNNLHPPPPPVSSKKCGTRSVCERGVLNGISHMQTNHLPPLPKGDRGGFYCAFVFPKITAAYLLYEQSLTIPAAQPRGLKRLSAVNISGS